MLSNITLLKSSTDCGHDGQITQNEAVHLPNTLQKYGMGDNLMFWIKKTLFYNNKVVL